MGDVPIDPLTQRRAHWHHMLFVPFGVYQNGELLGGKEVQKNPQRLISLRGSGLAGGV